MSELFGVFSAEGESGVIEELELSPLNHDNIRQLYQQPRRNSRKIKSLLRNTELFDRFINTALPNTVPTEFSNFLTTKDAAILLQHTHSSQSFTRVDALPTIPVTKSKSTPEAYTKSPANDDSSPSQREEKSMMKPLYTSANRYKIQMLSLRSNAHTELECIDTLLLRLREAKQIYTDVSGDDFMAKRVRHNITALKNYRNELQLELKHLQTLIQHEDRLQYRAQVSKSLASSPMKNFISKPMPISSPRTPTRTGRQYDAAERSGSRMSGASSFRERYSSSSVESYRSFSSPEDTIQYITTPHPPSEPQHTSRLSSARSSARLYTTSTSSSAPVERSLSDAMLTEMPVVVNQMNAAEFSLLDDLVVQFHTLAHIKAYMSAHTMPSPAQLHTALLLHPSTAFVSPRSVAKAAASPRLSNSPDFSRLHPSEQSPTTHSQLREAKVSIVRRLNELKMDRQEEPSGD